MDKVKSPLIFPVTLEGDTIRVLDETALPFREEYINVKNLKKSVSVLKSMKTRAFGQVLLFFYTCILERGENIYETIEVIQDAFKKARPTFDFYTLGDILKKVTKEIESLERAVEAIIANFDTLRRKRVEELAAQLPAEANILTICNVNGELIYLDEALKKLKKKATFYVCETRPYLQGTRLTLWELQRAHIPAQLLTDAQAEELMRKGLVNCVVTGADRATTQGDIINKIGTYSLAVLSTHYDIPFYPLTQYPRDLDIDNIEIEYRPGNEVFMYTRKEERFDALYPSFDTVPSNLISGWADISGFKKNSETRSIVIKKAPGNLIAVWGPLSKEAATYLIEQTGHNTILLLESRPFMFGFYNASILKRENFPFTYCTDNAFGFLAQQAKIKELIFMYKEKEGESYKAYSGSGYVTLLAKLHGIPIRALRVKGADVSVKDNHAGSLDGIVYAQKDIIDAEDEFVTLEEG